MTLNTQHCVQHVTITIAGRNEISQTISNNRQMAHSNVVPVQQLIHLLNSVTEPVIYCPLLCLVNIITSYTEELQ